MWGGDSALNFGKSERIDLSHLWPLGICHVPHRTCASQWSCKPPWWKTCRMLGRRLGPWSTSRVQLWVLPDFPQSVALPSDQTSASSVRTSSSRAQRLGIGARLMFIIRVPEICAWIGGKQPALLVQKEGAKENFGWRGALTESGQLLLSVLSFHHAQMWETVKFWLPIMREVIEFLVFSAFPQLSVREAKGTGQAAWLCFLTRVGVGLIGFGESCKSAGSCWVLKWSNGWGGRGKSCLGMSPHGSQPLSRPVQGRGSL